MTEIRYPKFNRGRILKIGMLESLRDLPRDALDCFCEDLSDGIVCGFTPIVYEDTITFSKGILKYKGELFVVRDLTAISYAEINIEVAIKIIFMQEEEQHDFNSRVIDFIVDDNATIGENEIELGRFKLKKGAYLRSNYQDLNDFTTEYNTINIVNMLYAGYNRPTLSPLILRYFAKAALELNPKNHLDITFAMLCLNSTRMEMDVILHYLRERLVHSDIADNLPNHEIHAYLLKAFDLVKKEGVPKRRMMNQRTKVMLD